MTNNPADVTQADRDAAAEYFELISESISAINARLGIMDDLWTVQAFARNRIASITEAADEIERLRAALQQSRSAVIEECAALIEQIAPSYYDQGGTYVNRASAAKAIRALSQENADDRT